MIPSCQNSVSITYFYRFLAIFVKQVCISQIIVIPSCQNSVSRTVLICYFLLTILSVDHRDAHDNIGYCGAMRQKVKCLTCSIISSRQVYWSTTHMRTPNRNHYYHSVFKTQDKMRQWGCFLVDIWPCKCIKICKRCWRWQSLFCASNWYHFQQEILWLHKHHD